jgi:hypothetical protein
MTQSASTASVIHPEPHSGDEHPAWCNVEGSCEIAVRFPEERQHASRMTDIGMSLEMPWRDKGENAWHLCSLTVAMTQKQRESAPAVELGIEIPPAGLFSDQAPDLWVRLTVEEATALRDTLDKLLSA